jgi:hypothetical protein
MTYKVNMRYAFEARITELIIIELFTLIFYGIIAIDDVERYFRQNRFIKGPDYKIYMRAFRAYLEKDYEVAIHLGLVLIERMLFSLLQENKTPLIHLDPQKKTAILLPFDQLLDKGKNIIPADLLTYLSSKFSKLGMGLYEVISRGFLTTDDYSPRLAAACILCLIQLARL